MSDDAFVAMTSVCLAGPIIVGSTNRYEEVIEEIDTNGSRLTRCSIPTDPNSQRPLRRTISTALFGLGLYCVFIRFDGCAA